MNVISTVSFGVFGQNHDNQFSSKKSYIANINTGLGTGCNDFGVLYYDNITNQVTELYDYVFSNSHQLLDTVLSKDSGMSRQNICEIYLRQSEYKSVNTTMPKSNPNPPNTIFPNPTKNQFAISINENIAAPKIRVYDMMGKQIIVESETQGNQIIIDASKFSRGMYYVELWNNEQLLSSHKLIKLE
jgi:hypothetical protein